MTLRSRPLACVFVLFMLLSVAETQDTGDHSGPVSRPTSPEQLRLREKWFRKGRVVPGRATAAMLYSAQQRKLRQRAQKQSQLGIQAFAGTNNAVKPWVPLGPAPLASNATGSLGEQDYGPVVGRATAVVVDPGDPTGNLVYVGGAYGGLWKSTNAAASNAADVFWTPLLDDQPTLAVGAIALKPTTGVTACVILVGTGEANNAPDSYYGLGILRSVDAGAHWTLISSANGGARPFRGLAFSKIAFSTANPNLVVAAVAASNMGVTEDAENPQGVNRGLYYSSDAGATWNYATVQDSGVTISPSSVTSVIYAPASGLFFAAVRYHGIYVSATGSTWQRLGHEPGVGLTLANCPTATSSNCPFYRAEIATLANRNELYVWYVNANDEDQGIFQSKDSGENWTQISDSGILNCGDGPYGGCGTEQGSYNLALTAISNGSATDLWAGAINLYKCTISSINQHCEVTPFKNLTHVYGCNPAGSLSHVHPNQHAMAFLPVSPNVVFYFVNDGGIYRTLNAYDPNFSGDCGGSNPFQNLNGTMGSLLQFISFAQDPGDRTTFLGGAQANGSPATNSLHGTSWISVNGGDGGFGEINPNSMDDWFTANSFVSVQHCALGIDCLAQDFSTVVNSGTVGGDSSAFYMPYMLDPEASTRLIVGTCRVWRGNSNGTSFSALSFNFDDDTSSTCTGEELNLIRSMAAGGATSANGSKVIYAGTEAGRVFVTTDADSGAAAWVDRTGAINPGSFPISSIAIDPSDETGRTAFVTVMGFGVSHVFRTQDAGGHWTDASGSEASRLPDAPANSLLVDPSDPLTVYVGTDVGVFVTHDAGGSWVEMGPTSGAGMLPNAPVTWLRMFDAGGTVRLRASTYGRGLWEIVLVAKPDFSLSMDDSELTLFANQAGGFTGALTSLDGYASTVNLSCNGDTLPGTCTLDPAAVTPTTDRAPFSVHVGGTPADYSFNIRAAGTDSDHITHSKPVTLHIIDFGLSAPSSNAVDVNQGSSSAQITFQVSAQGSFNADVTLSCTAIAGLTCNFSPSSTVSPTGGHPVTVHLTISAAVNTQLGASTVTIQATAPGAPAVKTQLLTVTVKNLPDYTLTTPSLQLFSMAGQQVTFPVSLTPVNGYRGPVNVTCDASTLGANCAITPSGPVSLDPGHLVNGSAVVNASFTVPGLASTQVITITINTSDATYGSPAHNLQVTLTIGEFRIVVPYISRNIHAGETAHFELDYAPPYQIVTGNVTFSCGALPALARCSFAPNPIAANAPATVILSISTTAPVAALAPATFESSVLYACFYLLPLGAVLYTEQRQVGSRKRRLAQGVLFVLVISALILFVQCGGGNGGGGGGSPYVAPSQAGTPVGTYAVNVTAHTGTATRRITVTLTVQ